MLIDYIAQTINQNLRRALFLLFRTEFLSVFFIKYFTSRASHKTTLVIMLRKGKCFLEVIAKYIKNYENTVGTVMCINSSLDTLHLYTQYTYSYINTYL